MTLLIEILCAPDDADALVDALRDHGIDTWITLQPIEIAPESLKDAIARVLPYWQERIAPALKSGQRVMIAAHGNSLRALVKHLSAIPDDEITELEIPTGQPIVYDLDGELNALDRYYLSER